MENIIMYMGLSGSVAFILYCIFRLIWRESASATFRYRLLKLSMCFFLIPLPYYSLRIRDILHALFPAYSVDSIPENTWIYDVGHTIYNTPKGIVLPWQTLSKIMLFMFGIFVTVLILIAYEKNFRKIHQLERCLSDAPEFLQTMTENMRQELGIRRKISVYYLNESYSPFCYGFFHPKIVITGEHTPEEHEMLLRHELWHIKSHDYLVRLLAFLIIALHFMNPIVYLLFHEISKISELACDEHVVSDRSENERIKYGRLLLDNASTPAIGYGNAFGNSKKIMKERILMIKNPRKMKYVTFICCAILTICFSTASVAGYQPVILDWEDNVELARNIDMYMFVPASIDDTIFEDANEEYFKQTNSFFINENGDVCLDLTISKADAKVSCKHTYEKGTLYKHDKNSSGGCTYTKYSAEQCSKCGNIKNKKHIYTLTYPTCPHK